MESHDAVWGGLLALADTLPGLAESMIDQLSAMGVKMSELTNLIANPEATRADELYRRSVRAFVNDWFEEAARDSRLALEADPYHFGSYYLLGRIAILQQQPLEAGAAFAKAARYAAPTQPGVAAAAALAGMHSYRGTRNNEEMATELGVHTVEAIHKHWKGERCCPQLLLATSRLAKQPKYAARAFLLDPDLLSVAVAGNLPHVEEACEEIITALAARVQQLGRFLDESDDEHVRPLIDMMREFSPAGQRWVCSLCDRPLHMQTTTLPASRLVDWAECDEPIEPNGSNIDSFLSRTISARSRNRNPSGPSAARAVAALATTELELYRSTRLGNSWILGMLSFAAKAPEAWKPYSYGEHYNWAFHHASFRLPAPLLPKFIRITS